MHRLWVEADWNDDSHCTACCHVTCSECREMCGVVTNNIVFGTLPIVTSPGSKRPVSHYVSILQVVTRVPKATEAEMLQAVASAKEAFRTWSQLSILSRQQVMFRYQDIIRRNMVNTKMCWTVKCYLTWLEVQKLILFCSVDMDIFYCVASF